MLKVTVETIIFTVVNLLILLIAFRFLLFKPVQKIIAARQEEADKQFQEAAKKQEEAEKLKTQYEGSLVDFEEEKKQVLKTAKDQANQQYQKIVSEAKAEAKNIWDKATAEAETQKEQILKSAEKEIADIIVNAATKVVGEQSSAEGNTALYDEFLDKAGE